MSINLEKQDKFALLKFEESKLTSVNAPELKTHFTALHAEGVRNMIVDLTGVEYCDSSGLSAILAGNRFCKQMGGTFVICGVKETVKKIISISQLDKVLNITPTYTEAADLVHMDEVERDLLNE